MKTLRSFAPTAHMPVHTANETAFGVKTHLLVTHNASLRSGQTHRCARSQRVATHGDAHCDESAARPCTTQRRPAQAEHGPPHWWCSIRSVPFQPLTPSWPTRYKGVCVCECAWTSGTSGHASELGPAAPHAQAHPRVGLVGPTFTEHIIDHVLLGAMHARAVRAMCRGRHGCRVPCWEHGTSGTSGHASEHWSVPAHALAHRVGLVEPTFCEHQ